MPAKRLLIDARESGTSTGRYVDKLVEYLAKLQPEYEIKVLIKSGRLSALRKLAPQFEVVPSGFKEFTFAEQLGFKKQLKSLRPDLVHFAMTQQPVLYRGKTVTTIHDLTTARFRNPAKNWLVYKFKQIVYKYVIKHVAHKSNLVITPSQYVKDDLIQFTGMEADNVRVIYEAADAITEPARTVAHVNPQKFIMYLGRPLPHKNLPRLIEAFQLLQADHPKLQLVLAGKKDVLYRRMEALVAKQQIKNIVFTDFVSEGGLRWLYENTAAYIFPSLSEGFGLPGLEAMVHGAPVVSSSATCLPEIYGSAAHYFDPNDGADMAAKINDVLVDEALRQKLIKAGHAQAKKYSWTKMAKQTLEVYKQVLGL